MEVVPESFGASPYMDSQPPTSQTRRTQILYTCGVSLLTIAHKAYRRAENSHRVIGSIAHKVASFAGPFVYIWQYQWLTILSFADKQILDIEDMIEALFPSSAYVFDKIDGLVIASETLPGRFDSFVDHFPAMVHQVPALNCAIVQFTATLNFLISTLTNWSSDHAKVVRDIAVDVNCDEQTSERTLGEHPNDLNRAPHLTKSMLAGNSHGFVDARWDEIIMDGTMKKCICENTNSSFGDSTQEEFMSVADEMGEEEAEERAYEKNLLCIDEAQMPLRDHWNEKNDLSVKEEPILELIDEPILELIDAGWQINSFKRK